MRRWIVILAAVTLCGCGLFTNKKAKECDRLLLKSETLLKRWMAVGDSLDHQIRIQEAKSDSLKKELEKCRENQP